MELTDILYQYLMETQYEELKGNETYQEAKAERDRREGALLETMTELQQQMYYACIEQNNLLSNLEIQHFLNASNICVTFTRGTGDGTHRS